jgi:hypothetical protein
VEVGLIQTPISRRPAATLAKIKLSLRPPAGFLFTILDLLVAVAMVAQVVLTLVSILVQGVVVPVVIAETVELDRKVHMATP